MKVNVEKVGSSNQIRMIGMLEKRVLSAKEDIRRAQVRLDEAQQRLQRAIKRANEPRTCSLSSGQAAALIAGAMVGFSS
jgi:hypothetical protein